MHNGDEPEHTLCRLLRHIFFYDENILWIKVKVNTPGEMQ